MFKHYKIPDGSTPTRGPGSIGMYNKAIDLFLAKGYTVYAYTAVPEERVYTQTYLRFVPKLCYYTQVQDVMDTLNPNPRMFSQVGMYLQYVDISIIGHVRIRRVDTFSEVVDDMRRLEAEGCPWHLFYLP